jgi:hypothetical protein
MTRRLRFPHWSVQTQKKSKEFRKCNKNINEISQANTKDFTAIFSQKDQRHSKPYWALFTRK